jgi:hypothetical protein
MITFTPKKFLAALELNDILFTHIVKCGIDRSYFIPRYKEGSKKAKDLSLDYKKELRLSSVQKIATKLVESGFFKDKDLLIWCFQNDDFDKLIPEDLL